MSNTNRIGMNRPIIQARLAALAASSIPGVTMGLGSEHSEPHPDRAGTSSALTGPGASWCREHSEAPTARFPACFPRAGPIENAVATAEKVD